MIVTARPITLVSALLQKPTYARSKLNRKGLLSATGFARRLTRRIPLFEQSMTSNPKAGFSAPSAFLNPPLRGLTVAGQQRA
jgi:hypothetical protein